MTGIARYVHDPKIKQLLRDVDGIGAPATQAAIIQTLFNRRFIETRGRQVTSIQIGRALIQVLPDVATRPDMTALWEAAMRRIADGQMPLEGFLGGVLAQLRRLVEWGRALGALKVPGTANARPRRVPVRSASERARWAISGRARVTRLAATARPEMARTRSASRGAPTRRGTLLQEKHHELVRSRSIRWASLMNSLS